MTPDFQRLADLSADIACVLDSDARIRWANERMGQRLGRGDSELVGSSLLTLVHPDDLFALVDTLEVVLSAPGRRAQVRVRLYTSWEDWRWVSWSCMVHEDVVYATGTDVTDEVRDRSQTESRMGMLALAEGLAGLGHWHVDLENQSVFWSDEVYRIHGRVREEYRPDLKRGIDAYHPEDRPRVQAAVTAAIEEQEPFEFEARILRPDGSARWVHSIGQPQVDPRSGATVGIFGVFRDISDDSRFLRSQDLEEFAHLASHDLKEPLRTIKAYLDILADDLTLEGSQARCFRYVVQASDRMNALIESLLAYSVSGQRAEQEAVPLGQVTSEVLGDLKAQLEEVGARIDVSELPDVAADPVRMRQVFQNLLSNAIKFRRPGEPLVVRVSAEPDGADWVVTVADNGRGFEQRHADRIFKPFQRLQGRDEVQGTGMGLALVDRIVRQLEGDLWVKSTPGAGSSFFLRLPGANSLSVTGSRLQPVGRSA